MVTLQSIKQIIEENSATDALEKLQPLIDELKMNGNFNSRGEALLAAALAEKGKLMWKLGNKAEAISCYEASAQEDPTGPGALLLEHSNGIMDFFNPDLLNP
ncbi:MAG: hypothetical protein NC210_01195 [[Clostridium] fimetarium]|nr:hypothetical protein [Alistipes timonensis]MCM1405020.1 hypothetical protein [[Clostridium] fimetarium]